MILNKKLENYWLILLSLPSWECGLKSTQIETQVTTFGSLPSWECGLKSLPHDQLHTSELSLPSWECGLKLANKLEEKTNGGHSLRGSVD